MSKTENYVQTSIFDGIVLSELKKNTHNFVTKRCYQLTFIELTKLLVHDKISIEEYRTYLHTLCENYRKEFCNVK